MKIARVWVSLDVRDIEDIAFEYTFLTQNFLLEMELKVLR
jgi:hypothetical protein